MVLAWGLRHGVLAFAVTTSEAVTRHNAPAAAADKVVAGAGGGAGGGGGGAGGGARRDDLSMTLHSQPSLPVPQPRMHLASCEIVSFWKHV